jgi:hypothetical protein
MKALGIIVTLLCALPAAAQDGPIARSVRAQYARPDVTTTYSTEMRSKPLFWSGVALVAGGAVAEVAGVTWAQTTDERDANMRFAPCGTDPATTRQPIGRCQHNTGLLVIGAVMGGAGGLLMAIGGQTVQITQVGPRTLALRVVW